MTPAFSYPEPQPEWPSWYSEYRYGAFYLFPPPDVMHRVNALRSHYDPPSAAICDAHVSLTVPLPRPLDVATLEHVTKCLAAQPAFTLEWGPPRVGAPARPGEGDPREVQPVAAAVTRGARRPTPLVRQVVLSSLGIE